ASPRRRCGRGSSTGSRPGQCPKSAQAEFPSTECSASRSGTPERTSRDPRASRNPARKYTRSDRTRPELPSQSTSLADRQPYLCQQPRPRLCLLLSSYFFLHEVRTKTSLIRSLQNGPRRALLQRGGLDIIVANLDSGDAKLHAKLATPIERPRRRPSQSTRHGGAPDADRRSRFRWLFGFEPAWAGGYVDARPQDDFKARAA